jgi:tetratricopeptide (TPR) repeat protein
LLIHRARIGGIHHETLRTTESPRGDCRDARDCRRGARDAPAATIRDDPPRRPRTRTPPRTQAAGGRHPNPASRRQASGRAVQSGRPASGSACERRQNRRGVRAAFSCAALQAMRRTAPDQLPEVASVWASALALWREVGDVALQVEALLGQAYCLWRASPEQARALLQDALQLAKREGKRPLAAATALHNAGLDWYGVGQLGVADQLFQQAMAIYEKLAPNSLEVARTLNNLGSVARSRGDLARAEQLFQQALAIYEKLAPNSLEVASTLNNLGVVTRIRGDLARAEQLFQQALAIFEQLAPNSLEVASTLNNLGNVARNRGDLARAEQLYQQALAIYEKLAPNSLQVATTLNNLGNVARESWRLGACGAVVSAGVGDLRKTRPQLAGGGRHAPQSGECGC